MLLPFPDGQGDLQ